ISISDVTNYLDRPSTLFTIALYDNRQGEFSSAVQSCSEVLSVTTEAEAPGLNAEVLAVEAMSDWQLKQTESAHATLSRASRIIDGTLPKENSGDLGSEWVHWIVAQSLL